MLLSSWRDLSGGTADSYPVIGVGPRHFKAEKPGHLSRIEVAGTHRSIGTRPRLVSGFTTNLTQANHASVELRAHASNSPLA